MKKLILVSIAAVSILTSCGGGSVKPGVTEMAVKTVIVGIGPIENVATMESYTVFGAVTSGILFVYSNGNGSFKVDMDSVSEAFMLADSSDNSMRRLSNNTLACVYKYEGKVLIPSGVSSQVSTETTLTNKQSEFLPRLVMTALKKTFPDKGLFSGRMFLKNLSYENLSGQRVLFKADWLIIERRP